MAIAAPARRSDLQTAPGPSRSAPPPEPKKRPRDRPRPGESGRSSAAAPAALRKEPGPKRKSAGRKGAATRTAAAPARKQAGARAATAAPARKAAPRKGASVRAAAAPARKAAPRKGASAGATTAPARKAATRKATTGRATAAPARKAPARRKAAPKRRTGARVIPIAAGHAGRAAVAVTQLPESGLIYRLTRGRAWIGVLGVLLVGIVALNVVTLSFAASAGKVDARNTELSRENSALLGRQAARYGQARMRHEAAEQGLVMPTEAAPQMITARPSDVAEAAARLAAAQPKPE